MIGWRRIAGVALALALGLSNRLVAQSVESAAVVESNAPFNHYRAPASFLTPEPMRVRQTPRGLHMETELQSADQESLYVYMTAFTLRRAEAIPQLSLETLAPCRFPELPEGGDFDRRLQCEGRIGGNDIQREIRIKRQGDLLLLAIVAWRKDHNEAASRLLHSLAWNPDFYVPGSAAPQGSR